MKKLMAITLLISMLVSLAGCGTIQSTDLMEDIKGIEVAYEEIVEDENAAVTDFAVRLLQNSMEEGENTLISPLSVLVALAMTVNGAEGETRTQMEEVLGMSAEDLNTYVHAYMESLPEEEGYKLSLANSIWFTDDEKFTVNEDFLQLNADYYGAGIYETPFDDSTRKDINLWVEENTDGMIKDILDKIPDEAVMYLVNALAFEAEWPKAYEKSDVREGIFTTEDGVEQVVELMHSSEYQYLEDENAKGFIKYYLDNKYAFAALLPDENVSVEEYVNSLTGERLHAMLSAPADISVTAAIPKFETEYDVEMSDVLKEMGMSLAFEPVLADFSNLGTDMVGNIFISRVLHKTFISVAEKGTKAGAATVVEMTDECAMVETVEPKEVILDRPFVYMLIDCEHQIPFFIGTMMNVEK